MQFRLANGFVYLDSSDDSLELTREQFLELEPDAVLPPIEAIEVWQPDLHYIQNPDQRDGSFLGDRSIYIAKISEYKAALAAQVAPPTIAQLKQQILAQINAHAEQLFSQLTAPYPTSEALTWPYKLKEAEAFKASGDPNNAPKLAVEAASRGVSLTDLAQTIVTKSEQYQIRCAQICGVRGKHSDAIAALSTSEELQAYDWQGGWN